MLLASSINPVDQLDRYGPDRCGSMSVDQARAWCRTLARSRYENFTVLSTVVPRHLRDDFAAVYAFCRWADDLADEVGNAERASELLEWWRRELHQGFDGSPRHPVFIALSPTIRKHDLPVQPFDDLISAFEQDQHKGRYETWDDVMDYCRRSANPVGRLVLMVCGEPRTDELFRYSDATCTALQLTNHWQDVRRDILDRDRIYIPRELTRVEDFENRLLRSARQGYGVDHAFLDESRQLIRTCVERTWPLYEEGAKLLERVGPQTRPLVWLLAAGGQYVLRAIEQWNYETALHRPKLGWVVRCRLVARAWLQAKLLGAGRRSLEPVSSAGEGASQRSAA